MAEPEIPRGRLLDNDADLARVLAEISEVDRYGIDTEFHRERTYFPQVALIQIAYGDQIVLIDPLAVDLQALKGLFDSDVLAIMHASRQDLEVFEHSCGTIPRKIFDTQIAGGFLGFSTPSLATLLEKELAIRAPKADRLTDWMRRPLTDRQLVYAAADVAHLCELHSRLVADLESRGRLKWSQDATQEMIDEPRGPRDPLECWRRIKEVRHLRGVDLATAQGLAAWREDRARMLDLTPRFVLADLGVVGLAVARPTNEEQMKDVRGIDARSLRNVAADLLEVIARSSAAAPRRDPAVVNAELPAALRPALPLVSAWVTQLSRELKIEPAMLATRTDLEAFLRGDGDARLARGWRAELVGEPVRRLVDGEVALAFDRHTGLTIEPRGPRPA